MLDQLDPNSGVPDALYIAALKAATTPSEMAFRDVLKFHRDFLNGGFDQVLFNLGNCDEPLAPYLAAYRLLGLHDAAHLIERAKIIFDDEGDLEEIDDLYVRLTYGPGNDLPDAMEAAAVRFAQGNQNSFLALVQKAATL